MKTVRLSKILILAGLLPAGMMAFAPTNFFPPYDPGIRLPDMRKMDPLRIGVNVEYGESKSGRNSDSKKRNVLQLHDNTQSALAMLRHPATAEMQTKVDNWVRNNWGHRIDEAGDRGRLRFTGKFEGWDVTPHMRYELPFDDEVGSFALSAHVPVRYAKIYDFTYSDLTPSRDSDDANVKEYLTDHDKLTALIKDLGGLNIGNWDTTGLGDLVVLLDWHKMFMQEKSALKDVVLHAKLGVSCPTGEERDEDQALSMALGNDGAWGMPLGIGLDLDFKYHVRLGAEAEFLVQFDNTKTRRIKTWENQTDFLLLEKGRASLDHGLEWKFFLYLQGFRFWNGLSLRAAYEYVKHDGDTVTPKSNDFSSVTANSTREFNEWNVHQFIFQLNYDCLDVDWAVKPQISLFYKLPVDGKNIIYAQTFGGQIAVSF